MNMIMKTTIFFQFLKDVKLIIIFSVLFILFKSTIEDFIEVVIVDPIISRFEISILSDLVFVSVALLFMTFVIHKISINYYVSNKTLFLSLVITSIYIYYRIEDDTCMYYGLSFYNSVKLLDIIPLIFIGLTLIKILHKKNTRSEDSKKGFFLDIPLGENKDDLLNRESLAKQIASEILNTDSPNSSFAIGISSEWGFGKTSFLDLMERHLDKKSNVVIKINPWINHDSRNIIKDFFRALSTELAKYNSEITPLIKKYSEILIGMSNGNITSFFNSLTDLGNKDETISDEFNAIDEAINKIDKKIIIFIDDLDRLYENEIIQIVKLIRNSANFGNTFFIVAYDRNYIVNAIKLINNYNPELFLEKIFQLEIRLPNFESQIIQKRIFELLSSRVTEEDKEELVSILLAKKRPFEKNVFNSGTLTTLRDATRFSNSFLIAYNYLKGEIVLSDLLNLELLRLKYPSIYKLIFFHREEFLETKTLSNKKTRYSLRKKSDDSLGIKNETKDEDDTLIIKDYLLNNYEKLGISKSEIDKAIILLYSLFPDFESIFYYDESSLLSVNNPSSFDRYSHYRLLDTNISEIEFSTFRLKPIDEFCSKIDYWISKGLRWELKTRFEQIKEYSGKSDFENIINAIFHLARIPKNEKISNDYSGFDFNNLYSKLSDPQKYIDLKYFESENEYIEFIVKIFKEAPSPFTFEIEFIYTLFDEFSITYSFIVPKEKFEEIRLDYFKKYLSSVSETDSYVWHLYYYTDLLKMTELGSGSFNRERVKNPKATELLIAFAKDKALDSFLFDLIEKDHRINKKRYVVGNIITSMFGSFDSFGEFLNEFEEKDHKYLSEFKTFFQKFKETKYQHYVEFNFQNIPIK